MTPKWVQKWPKNDTKMTPKMTPKWIEKWLKNNAKKTHTKMAPQML